jgi:hypothetical protein
MDRLLAAMAREPVHTTELFLEKLQAIGGEAEARDFGQALHA